MEEICQHLAALTQAVKTLKEGYVQLEEREQSLATPASTTSTSTSTSAARSATTAPIVMMLPPEGRVERGGRAGLVHCPLMYLLEEKVLKITNKG